MTGESSAQPDAGVVCYTCRAELRLTQSNLVAEGRGIAQNPLTEGWVNLYNAPVEIRCALQSVQNTDQTFCVNGTFFCHPN